MVCDFGDWVLDLWFVIFDVVLVEYIQVELYISVIWVL